MFLNQLTTQEKYYFLELAHKIIIADGKIVESEKNLFNAFVKEMELKNEYELTGIDTNIILENISSPKVQKIFFVELLSLSLTDNHMDENEKMIIMEIKDKFSLSDEYLESAKNWIFEFNDVYKDGLKLID